MPGNPVYQLPEAPINPPKALLGLFAACFLPSALAAERQPNIVFILADDLGWADTTLYGHTKFHRTPNIDRLAKRGMTFTRAYSDSPLCSPTRSAILTGLSPARTGITAPQCHLPEVVLKATIGKNAPPQKMAVEPIVVTRLDTSYKTMAETLKEAGYATGHFGKWHLGPGLTRRWSMGSMSMFRIGSGRDRRKTTWQNGNSRIRSEKRRRADKE